MAWVTESDGSGNVAAGTGDGAQRQEKFAAVAVNAAATGKNILHDRCTLRVTADDELAVRAFGVVSVDLGETRGLSLDHIRAVISRPSIIDDIFVVAALVGKVGADGVHEVLVAARIVLVPSSGDEDVDVRAAGGLVRIVGQDCRGSKESRSDRESAVHLEEGKRFRNNVERLWRMSLY